MSYTMGGGLVVPGELEGEGGLSISSILFFSGLS